MNRIKKTLSFISLLLVLGNIVLPYLYIGGNVFAQEVTVAQATGVPSASSAPTPTETPTSTPVSSASPSPIPAASETPPTATPLPSAVPGSVPAPSDWKNLDSATSETINDVEVNKDYTAPQNIKVKVNFTKLPDSSGKLTIKEVKLSKDQVKQLEAASDTAYDITSTLTDGTFTYDLTLPLPKEAKGKKLEVKSAESKDELKEAQIVDQPKEEKEDTLTIKGLNHFTVFIITTPDPDTVQRVLINEILPNPVSGAEWIELFNNGTQPINLASGAGWTLRNSAGDSQTLSSLGNIAAADSAVFNAPANWLSNTAPETITLSNELGAVVDAVTISLTSPGFAIDHYPLTNESVGRKTDGVPEWMIFTTPTKGAANTLPKAAVGLAEVGLVNPNTGFPSWYKDSNGIALDLMEAADGFGISDPVDPANPFSQAVGFNAEGFWWSAEASIDRPVGTRTILVLAVEAAFAGEAAVDGEQSVQNRVRYRIDGLVPGETYTITHPFGEVDEVADEAGVINVTDDTGCFAGGGVTCNQAAAPNFSTPLSGQAGPYLTWTTFNTNPALTDPQLANPANPGRRYVGNPAIEHEVTGSPTGKNLFRVKGPDAGGPGVNSIETNLFALSGRLADTNAPVITIIGANPVNINQDENYEDAGATAVDNFDGNLTASIVTSGLPVDTSAIGAKTITYTVSDRAGNTASAQRIVNVAVNLNNIIIDTDSPVIVNPPVVNPPAPDQDGTGSASDGQKGTITIIEKSLPQDAQDFEFSRSSGGGDFTLDDDADSALANQIIMSDLSTKVYSFSQLNVPLGWVLKEITCSDPNNNSIVDLNTASVNLQLDKGEVITCTFTNIKKGSIAGSLFEDKNGNAVKEAGDLAISQRTVFLDSNDNGVLDSGETSMATDTLGNYQFSALMPGKFNIREVIPQSWFQTLPTSGKLAVDLLPGAGLTGQDFGSTLYYSIANGGKFAPIGLTDSVRSLGESIISVLGNGRASVVSIPDGTIITRVDGSTFDTANLSATLPLLTFINGIDTAKFAPVSVLQWGIPNIGLAFSKPITINLFAGQNFNGQTLNIFRSTTGSTGWTTEGLAAPQSCTVLLGICTFQTTLASYFAAAQIVPQAPPSNNTNSSSTSNSSSVCTDSKPGSAPILLSAVTSGPNQVTLTWSKSADPVSHYSIVYGLTAGNPTYGNLNAGGKDATSYVVNGLSGNTTYYFKIKAINGCNGSEYSNELSAAPGGATISAPAQGFSEEVLGIQTEKVKDDETKMEKPLNEAGILGASVNGATQGSQGIKPVHLVLSALGFLGFGYYRFFYKKNNKVF